MRRFLLATLLAFLALTAPAAAVELAPVALPAVPGSEAEPNGTSVTATPIVSGQRIRADLAPNADADYFSFTAAAGDRVFAATMTLASSTSTIDSQLRLLGPDGTSVVEFDDDNGFLGSTASSIAGAEIPAAGTYYLRVNHKVAGSQMRPYDLYLELRSGAPVAEVGVNDTTATALAIGGGYVSGALDPADDTDFYKVTLAPGDTVFVSMDLDPERDGTAVGGQLGFGPVGVNNDIIPINDLTAAEAVDPATNPKPGPSEAFFFTADVAGTYYIRANTPGNTGSATATYRISANILPAAPVDCRTYPITGGAIPDASIASFPVTVAEAARAGRVALSLDLTHDQMADLDISLRSPGGSEVLLLTDVGSGSPGLETEMDLTLDQFAALPPFVTSTRAFLISPEPSADLDWFTGVSTAGQWQLVMRDDTNNANQGTLNGAKLIVCPQAPEPTGETVFSADFESSDEGFTHSGTADEWERGTPNVVLSAGIAPLTTCGQGTVCFKTDLDGTYNNAPAGTTVNQDLVSPSISLAGRTGRIFARWQQWFQMEYANFDHMTVSVEEFDGVNATNSRPLYEWTGATMFQFVGVPSVNVGEAAGWSRRSADISAYAGKTIRLRFHVDADDSVGLAGLAVDDVRVFQPPQSTRTVTVTKAGLGGGTVTSAPAGITCPGTCAFDFAEGFSVVLTAAPNATSDVAGFTGCDSTTATTCTVAVNAARSVTATFAIKKRGLTVSKTGDGTGTVTSAPAGIDCGAICAFDYDDGTSVTLTATPSASADVTGFTGCGSQTATTCTVTMSAARAVTVTFTAKRTVTVTKAGTGAGTVTSTPAGIACGAACAFAFSNGTAVSLAAEPDIGSSFLGWSGDCTGTAACSLSATADRAVTATFALNATPTPTVTSTPGGNTTPTPTPTVTVSPTATVTPTVGPTPKPSLAVQARRKQLVVTLGCGGPACSAGLKVRADKDKIAPRLVAAALLGSRQLPAGGPGEVKLKFTKKALKKLAKLKKDLPITVTATFIYADGYAATAKATAQYRKRKAAGR